jgi:ABC-type nickel/cobalt efflux system permease component RcnA
MQRVRQNLHQPEKYKMNQLPKSIGLLVHGVAIICLTVVMVMQTITDLTMTVKLPNSRIYNAALTILVWSFLIWRIWKKPRKWGLGLGIFLFLVLAFQIWLWHLALVSPNPEV